MSFQSFWLPLFDSYICHVGVASCTAAEAPFCYHMFSFDLYCQDVRLYVVVPTCGNDPSMFLFAPNWKLHLPCGGGQLHSLGGAILLAHVLDLIILLI